MLNRKKPRVEKLLKTRVVRSQKIFRFSIKKGFSPKDGSLRYSLIKKPPNWIIINPKKGIISGMAPKVLNDRKFLITIKAENEHGPAVTQQFFIKVVLADVIDEIANRLMLILNLRKEKRFSDLHAHERTMLEYLYEVLMASDDRATFIDEMEKKAEKHGINIDEEPSLEDFIAVAEAVNPNIEQHIREELGNDHVLTNVELNNVEMTRLFRQGSQQLGMVSRPIWNYFAAIDRHNWSSVVTVLDAAAEAVIKLRTENLAEANKETAHIERTPSPTKK